MIFNTAINNDDNLTSETTIENSENNIQSDIQEKVFKIMGFETDNEKDNETTIEKDIPEKDNDTFSFTLDNENKKTLSELKKDSKTEMQKINEVNIEKFAQVEKLLEKMNSIDDTFINFLKNQNEVFTAMKNFAAFKNDMEIYFHSIIKNQSAIMGKQDSTLNAINSIAAKFKNVGNFFNPSNTEKEKEIIPEKEKVILRKGNKSNDDISKDYFLELRKHFSGNFCYEKELTENTFPVWKMLLENINDTNADTIEKSIRKTWSIFTKQNENKNMIAKKSNTKFIAAMIKTIAAMQKKDVSFDNSTLPDTVKDKAYFSKLFNMPIETISSIIDDIKNYGKIDKMVIEKVSGFIKNHNADISDHNIGTFINYIKAYIG